jgi:protein-S-isoprenylcysteine O-methyltransferase Ste14
MRLPIPAIVVPLGVLLLYVLVPGVKERPWTAARITGAIIAVIAYLLLIAARIQLGSSFSVRPQAKELITHGVYSRIANPMYVFADAMLFGLILALYLPWLLVLLAVWVVFQVKQARREAKVLHEKFGEAYLDYRKQTWF